MLNFRIKLANVLIICKYIRKKFKIGPILALNSILFSKCFLFPLYIKRGCVNLDIASLFSLMLSSPFVRLYIELALHSKDFFFLDSEQLVDFLKIFVV